MPDGIQAQFHVNAPRLIQRAGYTCPADPLPPSEWPDGGITPISLRWFVARVNTGGRDVRRAQDALAGCGYETFNPRWIDRSDRAKGEVIRPMFVGYLLFAAQDGLWGEAKRAQGVVCILGDRVTGSAAEVPEREMFRLHMLCPGGIHDPDPPRAPVKRFALDSVVRVDDPDSPLFGRTGIVQMDDAGRVKVLMDILGGAPVELRRAQLVGA